VAESFSVFDYLQPDENSFRGSSRISLIQRETTVKEYVLACFLQRLIAVNCTIPPDWLTCVDKATVVNEASTSFLSNNTRKIDIRIELPPLFGIGVENKPWAAERIAQLADYRAELDRRYQVNSFSSSCANRAGRPQASRCGMDDLRRTGRCAILSYSDDFLCWLLDCHQRSQADKVRHFLTISRDMYGRTWRASAGEDQDDVQ